MSEDEKCSAEYEKCSAEYEEQWGETTEMTSSSQPTTHQSSIAAESSRSTSWTTSSSSKLRGSETSTLQGARQEGSINPFTPIWSFGMTLNVPMLNLTGKGRTMVAYAASHEAVMYDYVAKRMHLLQGHRNIISCISVDGSGRWLVTADKGEDNTIIVWDTYEHIPVHTIFNPHPGCGTAVLAISKNAKYLMTIGNELRPTIHFWLWTFGKDKPDDSYHVLANYGFPVKACFNPDVQEHIMVAFEKQLVFFQWEPNDNKLISLAVPTVKNIKKFGIYTDCTYMDHCHECVASTREGYIMIFASTIFVRLFAETELQNAKIFVNAIRVSKGAINCIQSADGVIVSGDDEGQLKFFDKTVKILYWCQKFTLPGITYIGKKVQGERFWLIPAIIALAVLDILKEMQYDENNLRCEDYSEEYEHLYTQLVPTDATVQQLPFIVRDFIIATDDGRIAFIDYLHNKCDFFFKECDAAVTAIDTHDEEPYLCIAYANNTMHLYNYDTHELVAEAFLPENTYDEQYSEFNPKISYIKYSPQSLHLMCGTTIGSLWILEPIVLMPKAEAPKRLMKGRIIKIVFSSDSRFVAYADENSTVCLLKYSVEDNKWMFVGKIRSHYKAITDILFTPHLPSRLFTVGDDRHIVEYDLDSSSYPDLDILSRERFEQCAIPVCFIYNPPKNKEVSEKYFFVSDNQYKYKRFNDATYMCHATMLGPAYGCYEGNPVNKMEMLPKHDNKYLMYANKYNIGIQMFPPDGNPYKYVGTIAHPNELQEFRLDHEGRYIFTCGEEDNCVLMWQIHTSAVHAMFNQGGIEMEPYYCLIEGGIHGWLFREMQDLFYYMQILHQGENTVVPRNVNDKIPVSELPDLMRACGFYPSEYEIENMIIDVKYRNFDEKKTLKEEVTFLEFVQLYINYRPAHGICIGALEKSFETLCLDGDGPGPGMISRSSFTHMICERGEFFTTSKAHTCLATLMHQSENEEDDPEDFSFMPEVISFEGFLEDILGMNLERQTIEEADNAVNEAEDDIIC